MAFGSGANWKGNRKGRPKGQTLGDIYRKNKKFPAMADKVFKRLLASDDDAVVFNTIKFMVEIRDGRAPQSVDVSGSVDMNVEKAKLALMSGVADFLASTSSIQK